MTFQNPNYIVTQMHRGQDIVELIFRLSGGAGFISGGFARWVLSRKDSPEVPGDIDVFARDDVEYGEIRTRFDQDVNMRRRTESDLECKYEYRMSEGFHKNCYRIQLIKPLRIDRMVSGGDPYEVLDNFDFTIAKAAIYPTPRIPGNASEFHVVCHKDFHEHDANSYLVLTHIHCPISSMKRVLKYTTRGFKISSAELLKLFDDYEKRSPEWKALVARGLSGAYMTEEDQRAFARGMYMD